MAGVKDPERYTEARTWTGRPVTCTVCTQAGVPTWTSKGWRMPEHFTVHTKDRPTCRCIEGRHRCPGSGAAVEQPEHQTTKRLREQTEVPEAKGLTEDNPMEGPS